MELHKIYKENKMTTSNEREEIELFEKEWNHLIEKIKKENNVKY